MVVYYADAILKQLLTKSAEENVASLLASELLIYMGLLKVVTFACCLQLWPRNLTECIVLAVLQRCVYACSVRG